MKPTPPNEATRRAIVEFRAGKPEAAAAICREVLSADPNAATALELLGLIEGMHGDVSEARDLLERANALRPDRPELLNNLAIACRKSGDPAAGAGYLRRALKRHPTFVAAWHTLALIQQQMGDYQAALESQERITSLEPDQAEAWASLAQIRESLHQPVAAAEAAGRALELDAGSVLATMVLARIEIRQGEASAARERLESALARENLLRNHEIILRQLLGSALDRTGEPEAAFATFVQANRLQARDYHAAYSISEGPYALPAVRRIGEYLRDGRLDGTPTETDDGYPPPIFLMGFPRSGTTLLDRMLGAHPQLISIEEQETLIDMQRDFVIPPDGLERLAALEPDQAALYRQAYRRRLTDLLDDVPPADSRIIDKLPLNTVFLPLIGRIFPGARILFAIRDPRDVCLSCFMQSFSLNAAMAHFLDLELTVEYYREVMGLGLDTLERWPLHAHRVRYEELVTDPAAIVGGALDFLGLPWDDAVLDYRSGLAGSHISTPSSTQVSEPIYRSAIGRWRRYREPMSEAIESLAPMVRRLNYDSVEGVADDDGL
ncbi:MAG: sulfotransferase [Gammaproteobacteria bacterium]